MARRLHRRPHLLSPPERRGFCECEKDWNSGAGRPDDRRVLCPFERKRRKQKKALKKLNIFTIEDFRNFDDETYIIGQNIIEWKKSTANMDYFNEILSVVNLKEVTMKVKPA